MKYCWLLSSLVFLVFPLPVLAQITPDRTLGTQVTPDVAIDGILSERIDGGSIRGANLFHSFSDFNINTGRRVYFSNPDRVTNIFTRVTGTNPSHIDGTLGVLGSANLFLMNPNGIVFGQSARLDVQGSFLGTTASRINFADGTEFSTANTPLTTPLLTVSIPIGLGFGSNPGAITVEGTGHQLRAADPIFSPIIRLNNNSGLQVQPGKTLALVGGEINLVGGTLTAPGGRIEVGAVGASGDAEAIVSFNNTTQGFTLGYSGVSTSDIRLRQQSSADTSGAIAGSIHLQGRQISLNDGSQILIQNLGNQSAGDISVYATESLELSGTTPDANIRTGLSNETLGVGASGNINVSTQRLILRDGAAVSTRTYSTASSGNINIKAAESVLVSGFSPIDPAAVFSIIGSSTYGVGDSGNVILSTRQLSLIDGGTVAVATFGSGTSGNITMNADAVEVIGTTPALNTSSIATVSLSSGNAGIITINTQTLSIRASGTVTSNGLNTGFNGNVIVNASKAVEVSGAFVNEQLVDRSNISSSVGTNNQTLRQIYRLPDVASGNGGNVIINTPVLKVDDRATISVSNLGLGNAGTLTINADIVELDSLGYLAAQTNSGEGGNIVLQAKTVQMRLGGLISATANGSGNGGNITINADTVTQLENSDISANAVKGRGGNIQISTQGIFSGTDSDITASSQLGINGVVNIVTPSINQQNNLQQQASNFISTDTVVASSCLSRRNASLGRFVVTGNGGLPTTPENHLELPYSVVQVLPHPPSTPQQSELNSSSPPIWKIGDNVLEARELVASSDGRLLLTSYSTGEIASEQSVNCLPN